MAVKALQTLATNLGLRNVKLHIGAGPVHLKGWVNIDNQPYEGLDHVLDVTKGLPFHDVSFIFAEHFIEHLDYETAVMFLKDCRRVLHKDGILRLTTPNLDWVWLAQYHYGQWGADGEKVRDCFWINKSFRAWGHKFLYNFATLRDTLVAAGFGQVELASYGESKHEELRGLEHHELYPDEPGASHLIVAEAWGHSNGSEPEELKAPRDEYRQVVDIV
jgi:predicted SAM-dependent methyltransferase